MNLRSQDLPFTSAAETKVIVIDKMSSADVRDMLDLPNEGHPRPVKKQKIVEKRPGLNDHIMYMINKLLNVTRGHYQRTLRFTW